MSHKQPTIAVVCGGPSAEAEVSRSSGANVIAALRATHENVFSIELNNDIDLALRKMKPDVVFPVLHGPQGEDGTLQGFLEILGIPYVGSGVRASMCAMDKALAKSIFRANGLSVAKDIVVTTSENIASIVERCERQLGKAVVVKPMNQGSALGITFAHDQATLRMALETAFRYSRNVLIEQRIIGKEITCGILERDILEALPIIEIRTPTNSWYDYEHRYTPGLSEHIIPAELPTKQYARVQEIAKQAHIALGCRDLSRADFVVPESGDPILLEVNTLPGMTPTSLYPDEAKAAGISFEMLVALLVERAMLRKN